MVWDLMLIYKNDHPHASEGEYGGSIQILPVQPRLKDIAQKMMPILEQTYGSYENCARRGFGLGLPHIYRNNFGRNEEYFICTADPKYFKAGQTRSTSAASALSWACKWIMLCEMWLNGEISDDVAWKEITAFSQGRPASFIEAGRPYLYYWRCSHESNFF